jgi:hypothetical protein
MFWLRLMLRCEKENLSGELQFSAVQKIRCKQKTYKIIRELQFSAISTGWFFRRRPLYHRFVRTLPERAGYPVSE